LKANPVACTTAGKMFRYLSLLRATGLSLQPNFWGSICYSLFAFWILKDQIFFSKPLKWFASVNPFPVSKTLTL